MSLPPSINPQDENFFIPESIIMDPDLLYLYSLRDTDGLSEKSITIDGSEALSNTPLECYNTTVSFDKDVFLLYTFFFSFSNYPTPFKIEYFNIYFLFILFIPNRHTEKSEKKATNRSKTKPT